MSGCYNLTFVFDWIHRCIISIFPPYSSHYQQFGVWWSTIHGYRLRLRRRSYLFQHPVFSFCWTQHILEYVNADQPALCHDGNVDTVLDLLLVLHLGAVHRSFHVQPAPILVLGLRYRLSVRIYCTMDFHY